MWVLRIIQRCLEVSANCLESGGIKLDQNNPIEMPLALKINVFLPDNKAAVYQTNYLKRPSEVRKMFFLFWVM